jgi:hypothetical protein
MNIDLEIIEKCELLKAYTDMASTEFNNNVSQVLAFISNEDKKQILSHHLEVIYGLDFRKYQESREIGFRGPKPSDSENTKILNANTADDDKKTVGGFICQKFDGKILVGINLYYIETIDILGHEFAHAWYNHQQDDNSDKSICEKNEQEAITKAKEWGFNSVSFTARK